MNETSKTKKMPGSDKWTAEAYDWVRTIVFAVVISTLVLLFILRTVSVVGSSMVPTLSDGERVVVSRLFYTPRQGDIVVLRKESFMSEPIVKRVIAVAGQTVDIDFDAGLVYVDGEALEEDYVNSPTLEREDFEGSVTVPEGCVFVMGDNRNRSTDSRDEALGCVDERYIIGKALWRIWPIDKLGTVYK